MVNSAKTFDHIMQFSTSALFYFIHFYFYFFTCSPIIVFLVVLQLRGLRRQPGTETVLFVDAKEDRSSFQDQVLDPGRHRRLQVLLVD